jgi:hypothetical protein
MFASQLVPVAIVGTFVASERVLGVPAICTLQLRLELGTLELAPVSFHNK